MSREEALKRVVDFYETLTPQAVPRLTAIYAADARFKDPFNELRGHSASVRIFEHMYVQLHEPRFVVATRIMQGRDAFLRWELRFSFKRLVPGPQTIRGASHLRFDSDGLGDPAPRLLGRGRGAV